MLIAGRRYADQPTDVAALAVRAGAPASPCDPPRVRGRVRHRPGAREHCCRGCERSCCRHAGDDAGGTSDRRANWDLPQQREVLRAGLMSDVSPGSFGGGEPLSAASADSAMAALLSTLQASASWDAAAAAWGSAHVPANVLAVPPTLTVAGFDAKLVDQSGLASLAVQVQQATTVAGLQPPADYGALGGGHPRSHGGADGRRDPARSAFEHRPAAFAASSVAARFFPPQVAGAGDGGPIWVAIPHRS